jgi:hypothetical protein
LLETLLDGDALPEKALGKADVDARWQTAARLNAAVMRPEDVETSMVLQPVSGHTRRQMRVSDWSEGSVVGSGATAFPQFEFPVAGVWAMGLQGHPHGPTRLWLHNAHGAMVISAACSSGKAGTIALWMIVQPAYCWRCVYQVR